MKKLQVPLKYVPSHLKVKDKKKQEKERKRDEENKELKAMIEKLIERQPIQHITNNNNTIISIYSY